MSEGSPPNIQELLSRRAGEVSRPRSKPAGWYLFRVESTEFTESSQKKTPGIKVNLAFLQAHESVDKALLEGIKIQGTSLSDTFWITEDALWRFLGDFENGKLKTPGFAQHCGLEVSSDETLVEVAKRLPGCMVLGQLIQKPNKAGDSTFNEVTGYKRV